MTEREALNLALEALETLMIERGSIYDKAIKAIQEHLAQPEFIKHEVENADDWSEWVCPDPKGYLMKCCDCGLVHEAEFRVVRYKSETEREDCDIVDDNNLQAVFRMRRSEQWSPEDTAHRAGGLPMAQPEQHQDWCASLTQMLMSMPPKPAPCNCKPPQRTWVGLRDDEIKNACDKHTNWFAIAFDLEAKLKEKNT